jgi:two-component system cell cycle response regulator DivK
MNIQPKHKLLLVEDDYINALVMQHFYQDEYDFHHISNGHEVIQYLKEHTADVVILDINLGADDIDGIKIIEDIRRDIELSSLPVFALTGYAMRGDEELFVSKGFNLYISKPVDFNQLTEAIEDAINKNRD